MLSLIVALLSELQGTTPGIADEQIAAAMKKRVPERPGKLRYGVEKENCRRTGKAIKERGGLGGMR